MDTSQLSVFCYECDDFVINDTGDRQRWIWDLETIKKNFNAKINNMCHIRLYNAGFETMHGMGFHGK